MCRQHQPYDRTAPWRGVERHHALVCKSVGPWSGGINCDDINGAEVCFRARAAARRRARLEAQGDGVQTTLLGIAIALILALVTALVGPYFVDWNRYRAEFETQASRITGLTVNINGAVEARLLPTPTLTLGRIEIARP